MQIREHQEHFWVEFENGVSVEIRMPGSTFGGIGRVKWGRRVLRSPELPILPLIVSADGYEVRRLELDDIRQSDDELVMAFRPYVQLQGRMERQGERGEERWNVAPWTQEPLRDRGGRLWLCLREVNQIIGDIELSGFSYSYKFRSRKYQPSRIHDRATWELKGHATGNSFYMRGHNGPPRWTIRSKSDAFSTARPPDDQQPGQFLPFFTELQGFTYQFDRQCLLVTAFERPFHCLSLFQKNAGANCIIHWHQLCGAPDGAGCLEFPALEVMCAHLESTSEAERINQYETVRTGLHDRYNVAAGLRADRAMCVGRLISGPSARQSDLRRAVDTLAAAGCAEVLLADPVEEQIMTPAETGAGGGEGSTGEKSLEKMTRIAALAHERGLQVGVFLNPAMLQFDSPGEVAGESAPQEAPRAQRGSSGGKQHRRLLRLARSLKKQLPLDAFYLNGARGGSSQGACSTAPGGASVASVEARLALHRALQQSGFRCGGDRGGAFGVSAASVPYSLLRNNELLYRDTVMPFPHDEVVAAEDDPHEAYFRGYAGRLCYGVSFGGVGESRGGLDGWWDAEYAAVNKAYCAVREHMSEARMLAQEQGILWNHPGGDVRVLWAYKGFAWRVGRDARVYDVMAQKTVPLEDDTFAAAPRRVYLVQDALEP